MMHPLLFSSTTNEKHVAHITQGQASPPGPAQSSCYLRLQRL